MKGISYEMPIASAQVKSAILLAGLYAKGETTLTEPHKSRDHTEKMLKNMGVNIIINDNTVKLSPVDHELNCFDITIPNDFSSAAFFIAGACLVPDSEILIKQVNLNETRTGFIEVLKTWEQL